MVSRRITTARIERATSGLSLVVTLLSVALAASPLPARAQSADPKPPNSINEEVNPNTVSGLVKPAEAPVFSGPLSSVGNYLAEYGLTLHAVSIDFLTANPSAGLRPGYAENTIYNILGFDVDLSKISSLKGSTLHYETTIFAGNTDADSFLGQTGDSLVGYQGTYNIRAEVLSRATFEQVLLGGDLSFEIGRTHPNHYYALPDCQSVDSCFQDILYYNAGFTSPQYSVWGANLSYKLTRAAYVEAGAFSANTGARVGYDLGRETDTGVLGIAEIGSKTDFDTAAYPARYSATGFYNSSLHGNYGREAALDPSSSILQRGASGLVLQAQKVVWRADGGAVKTAAPCAVAVYASAATGFESTTPIRSDVILGATLQSPFAGRPADRFGVKFDWQQLNGRYTDYLAAANQVSGGSGSSYGRNEYVFELNAHVQLPGGLSFEPVVQYAINPSSYYNPFTSARSRDGVFAIGTLIVPVGVLLGLAHG